MYLPNDLLAQASLLAYHDRRGAPKQVNLRRAVSSAYYSLFHLLVDRAAALCAPDKPIALRRRVRRAFDHGKMRSVCRSIASGGRLPASLMELLAPIQNFSTSIQRVAYIFLQLQEARHSADYDISVKLTRSEVIQIIELAHEAYEAVESFGTSEESNVFLVALLLQDKWDR